MSNSQYSLTGKRDLPEAMLGINTEGEEYLVNGEGAEQLLDGNFNYYKPRMEHNGIVYVEKWLVAKDKWKKKTGLVFNNKGGLLVKETNFQDVGGGMRTYERHFATLPSPWYQYEEVTYRTNWRGSINHRDSSGGGSSWDKTRRVLARATHYYFYDYDLPTATVPEQRDAGKDFINDFTRIFTIAPSSSVTQWELNKSDGEIEVVIAPDKISVYMGRIYELVRYTVRFRNNV